eukprot:TRINITY_DN5397_c0_g2_i5.p1 TRINITY_DN5397_c0_g2~~TRINITY_DN5397_c0_g2_i5.p1  ORF type:complete len:205 (-),score=-7.18 TRINITY_DN5397_c0_g2_i5:105-719(-)
MVCSRSIAFVSYVVRQGSISCKITNSNCTYAYSQQNCGVKISQNQSSGEGFLSLSICNETKPQELNPSFIVVMALWNQLPDSQKYLEFMSSLKDGIYFVFQFVLDLDEGKFISVSYNQKGLSHTIFQYKIIPMRTKIQSLVWYQRKRLIYDQILLDLGQLFYTFCQNGVIECTLFILCKRFRSRLSRQWVTSVEEFGVYLTLHV